MFHLLTSYNVSRNLCPAVFQITRSVALNVHAFELFRCTKCLYCKYRDCLNLVAWQANVTNLLGSKNGDKIIFSKIFVSEQD